MTLASHPVPAAEGDAAKDEALEEEEVHEDEHCSIKVTQSPGFLCHIEATARVRLPPTTLWEQAIVHPGAPPLSASSHLQPLHPQPYIRK